MIAMLMRIHGYFSGGSEPPINDARQPDASVPVTTSDEKVLSASSMIPAAKHVGTPPKPTSQKLREHNGKITSVHNDYGMIDHRIYFGFDQLHQMVKPQVGDEVVVDASCLPNSEHGWTASSVRVVTEDWDAAEEEYPTGDHASRRPATSIIKQSKIGTVTEVVDRRYCYVTSGVEQLVIDLLMEANVQGFTPEVGDWITVLTNTCAAPKVEGLEPTTITKYEIKPLRSRDYEGYVSSILPPYGTVDSDIFFKFDGHQEDCQLSVGDLVRGRAMESKYGDLEWRSIEMRTCATADIQRRERLVATKNQLLGKLVQNKNEVEITSPIDFGVIIKSEEMSLSVCISNNGSTDAVFMDCAAIEEYNTQLSWKPAELQSSSRAAMMAISRFRQQKRLPNAVVIPPGDTASVTISCCGRFIGKFSETVVFKFDCFDIGRRVTFKIQDVDQHLLATPTSPSGPENKARPKWSEKNKMEVAKKNHLESQEETWTLHGRRPKISTIKLPVKMDNFKVPDQLWRCFYDEMDLTTWLPSLQTNLNFDNYKTKFSSLLHMEEIQATADMCAFDMNRQCMQTRGEYLVLEVPGLAEGRPSVMFNDTIVAIDEKFPKIRYQGCIHEVRGDDLLLQFQEDFHRQFTGQEMDIKFQINRGSYRRCHQAVSLFWRVKDTILFPCLAKSTLKAPLAQFDMRNLVNRSLNDRQRAAVRGIVEGRRRPAPYVIYGPPGTGKTVTVVESVIQVFLTRPDSRLLVSAPSNSAADLLCERLDLTGKVTTADMTRMNAFHRNKDSIPDSVAAYSDFCSTIDVMSRYRIIVTTCQSSGLLYSLGIRPGHFTHIFIDEAGQATEPETLIPICLAAAQNADECQIILTGDHQQLGPVLRSKTALKYGLQTSFLERLCRVPLYLRDNSKVGGYDPHFVTKLTHNYRSHECLITLSSDIFYDSELEAHANPAVVESLCNWKHLPNKSFPILFHGIRGEDQQESDSPSWYNAEEALQVLRYYQSLLFDAKLKAEDVGIITPYRKQVDKIRTLFRSVKTESPKIGSVEEFQGQERLAIILSTVRSSDDQLGFDLKHNLGFLSNPKRFNVSITRAQALMVIVGNPFVLIKDPHWRRLVRHCVANNAYIGCDVTDLAEVMRD